MKSWAVIPDVAKKAIAEDEKWDGCHWDAPEIIWTEQTNGMLSSPEADKMISLLNAEEAE